MHDPGSEHTTAPWASKRRHLFFRFTMIFGFMVVLVVGGMAALAFLITDLFGGDGQTAFLVWIGGLVLTFAFPVLAIAIAVRAFRRIASPLADVMAAADAVAEGDLSARAREDGRGSFNSLATSFNRMVEELQRTDQVRKNLTADVAHELRTPVHVIQGNLEGILDSVYEATPEHIGTTLEETRLLARLIDDLGTLSLAESGQLPLSKEEMDVDDFLREVVSAFASQAEAAGTDLTVESASDAKPVGVQADAGRMQQVLGNLVANAIRHTDSGGRIALRAAAAADGVLIEVEDTGAGIPPEDVPFVFDRFWRGDRSRPQTEAAGGGLGLAIARQLVQAHGARIDVRSEVGHGTTFTIEFPIGSEA